MAELFPIFLKLEKRRCLVVGAGAIAEQKITGLLAAGADVHIVAPEAIEQVKVLAAEGRLKWFKRAFEASDVERAFLVVAATGDPGVNEEIYRLCESEGVLCNAVDEPERCHFYYPAVVRRGDLQIAISTNGKSPALARRIRQELETAFGDAYGPWLEWLGAVRKRLFEHGVDPQRRKRILHRIASRDVYNAFVARRTVDPTQAQKMGLNGPPTEIITPLKPIPGLNGAPGSR